MTKLALTGSLKVEVLQDGLTAKLTHSYAVQLDTERVIVVPVNFETDFASVPRIFWTIVPPWGKYSPAAVVHDYLYIKQHTTRLYADSVFKELMKALGVSWWKRNLMYSAVRAGGWFVWNSRSR